MMTLRPSKQAGVAALRVRPLSSRDWPFIEQLFGPNGACGGCWCMWWRLPRGGKLWEASKGDKNRQSFRKLVAAGKVFGCLAFDGAEPIGWCCIGPRADFPRLGRTRGLEPVGTDGVWSVTCFYIRAGWRHRGVATALLRAAVRLARELGVKTLEAYPVRPKRGGKADVPPAFAWTGVPRLFEKVGFRDATPPGGPRDIYVRKFRSPKRRTARAR